MNAKARRAAYQRKWYAKNQERAREIGRATYRRNAEKRRAAVHAYQKANPEKVAEWRRRHREKPGTKERDRLYQRTRPRKPAKPKRVAASALERRIKTALRTRVYKALHGVAKSANTMALIGCSYEQFRAHIEAQFQPGMTWEGHRFDGWHLDHKRPCASFDLTDPEQQRMCFHYTNLQPLWAHDNLTKFSRWAA